MRPGQNRRVRGRNRNKGPNPLTRAFESNGPDVKIRGTAQHVADKYAQLARDAQASGDPVSAENYLQHAEHYYRLIAAAQEQLRQQYPGTYGRDEDGEEGDEDGMPANGYGYPGGAEEDGEGGYPGQAPTYEGRNGGDNRFSNEGRQAPEPRPNGGQHQQPQPPRFDNRPNDRGQQRFDRNGGGYDRNNNNGYDRNPNNPHQSQYDRQENRHDNRPDNRNEPRQDRQNGGRDRFGGANNRDGRRDYNRNDRPQGERAYADRAQGGQNDRGGGDRNQADRQGGERPYGDKQPERFNRERPAPAPRQDFADDAPDENAGAGLPAFLTTPVRAPVAASSEESRVDTGAPDAYAGEGDGVPFEDGEAVRPRRRRTRRPMTASGADEDVAASGPDAPVE